MKLMSFKGLRLILSGALLGVACANLFIGGVDFDRSGLLAGSVGAGVAVVLMKFSVLV